MNPATTVLTPNGPKRVRSLVGFSVLSIAAPERTPGETSSVLVQCGYVLDGLIIREAKAGTPASRAFDEAKASLPQRLVSLNGVPLVSAAQLEHMTTIGAQALGKTITITLAECNQQEVAAKPLGQQACTKLPPLDINEIFNSRVAEEPGTLAAWLEATTNALGHALEQPPHKFEIVEIRRANKKTKWGITINNSFIVTSVDAGSVCANAGVAVGSKIVAVDGLSIGRKTKLKEVRDAMRRSLHCRLRLCIPIESRDAPSQSDVQVQGDVKSQVETSPHDVTPPQSKVPEPTPATQQPHTSADTSVELPHSKGQPAFKFDAVELRRANDEAKWGITISNSFIVTSVDAGSVCANAGVAVGSKIVAVDGLNIGRKTVLKEVTDVMRRSLHCRLRMCIPVESCESRGAPSQSDAQAQVHVKSQVETSLREVKPPQLKVPGPTPATQGQSHTLCKDSPNTVAGQDPSPPGKWGEPTTIKLLRDGEAKWGITISNSFVVTSVDTGSVCASAGVAVGSKIVAVDGLNIGYKTKLKEVTDVMRRSLHCQLRLRIPVESCESRGAPSQSDAQAQVDVKSQVETSPREVKPPQLKVPEPTPATQGQSHTLCKDSPNTVAGQDPSPPGKWGEPTTIKLLRDEEAKWGITISNSFIVTSVDTGSVCANAGVVVGSKIVAVDGLNIGHKTKLKEVTDVMRRSLHCQLRLCIPVESCESRGAPSQTSPREVKPPQLKVPGPTPATQGQSHTLCKDSSNTVAGQDPSPPGKSGEPTTIKLLRDEEAKWGITISNSFVVTSVDAGSVCANAGIVVGSKIVAVDGLNIGRKTKLKEVMDVMRRSLHCQLRLRIPVESCERSNELAASPGTPAVDAPVLSGAPAADAPASSGAPAVDAPASSGAPAADAPAWSAPPAADAHASSGIPAAEATASSGTPAVDAPASSGAPAADAPASGTPAVEPPASSEAPAADAPASSGTPAADAPASSVAPAVEPPASSAPPAADAPASGAPAADAPASSAPPAADAPASGAPAVEPPASSGTPAVEPPASSEAPAADAPASSGTPAADTTASSGTPAADAPASSGAPAVEPPASSGTPAADAPASGAPAVEPPASSGTPAVEPPASSETPAVEPPASSGTPAADAPASGAPAVEPPASSGTPAVEPPASSETPAVEPPASSGTPAADTTASSAPRAADAPASGTPAVEPPASSGTPAVDAPASSGAPAADATASSAPPAADAPASGAPAVEPPASSGTPAVEPPASSGTPAVEPPASSGTPAADAPASGAPAADAPASSGTPAVDAPASSEAPAADEPASKSLVRTSEFAWLPIFRTNRIRVSSFPILLSFSAPGVSFDSSVPLTALHFIAFSRGFVLFGRRCEPHVSSLDFLLMPLFALRRRFLRASSPARCWVLPSLNRRCQVSVLASRCRSAIRGRSVVGFTPFSVFLTGLRCLLS